MSPAPTAETIEAEAAILRARVLAAGADLRRRADPAYITATARSAIRGRVKAVPEFLQDNALSIGLVVCGGALGVLATRLLSRQRLDQTRADLKNRARAVETVSMEAAPSLASQAKAIGLSALAMGVGYVGGMLIPNTSGDEPFFAQPAAVLRGRLNDYLKANMRGMKLAALNMVGASGLSSTTLVVFSMLAQLLASPTPKAERNSL